MADTDHAEPSAGILTEDLTIPGTAEMDSLEAVYRGLCHLPGVEGSKHRRIDFLTVPWLCRGAALLYYTVRLLSSDRLKSIQFGPVL